MTGSGLSGAVLPRLSAEPLLSDEPGDILFLGDGPSVSLRFLVGVLGSFVEAWEPRVRRTVGGSSSSGSVSCSGSISLSDGGVGECWYFREGVGDWRRGGAEDTGAAGGLESM